MRNTLRNWMLGTTLVAGLLGTGAAAANAAGFQSHREPERRFDGGYNHAPERGFDRGYGRYDGRVVVGRSYVEGYRPTCPGVGYVWNDGYYNDGYWVPGAWVYGGGYGVVNRGYGYDRGYAIDRGRDFARDDHRGDRGWDRGGDRDRGHDRDFRGRR